MPAENDANQESTEVTYVLTAENPNAPSNIVEFSYVDGAFKPCPYIDQTEVHFSRSSNLILKDSSEARMQRDAAFDRARAAKTGEAQTSGPLLRNKFNFTDRAVQGAPFAALEAGSQTAGARNVVVSGSVSSGIIYDHFRSLEAAAAAEAAAAEARRRGRTTRTGGRTGTDARPNLTRVSLASTMARIGTMTEGAVSEGVVSDGAAAGSGRADLGSSGANLPRLLQSLRTAERIVATSALTPVLTDAAFWDDPADAFRTDASATALPITTFAHGPAVAAGCAVTALAPHPKFGDVLAVAYGPWDAGEGAGAGEGFVAIYTDTNYNAPDAIVVAGAGVTSVAWCPTDNDLIAIGRVDGEVVVISVSELAHGLAIQGAGVVAASRSGHRGAVWGIEWRGGRALSSCSADGTVVHWALVGTALQLTSSTSIVGSGGRRVGGAALSVCPSRPSVFALGTDDGTVALGSTDVSSHYIRTFVPHAAAVLQARWCPVLPRLLITTSLAGTIQLYDYRAAVLTEKKAEPVETEAEAAPAAPRPGTPGTARPSSARRAPAMELPSCDVTQFDDSRSKDEEGRIRPLTILRSDSGVVDVDWSPIIPTSFAAICEDGTLLVYDLSVHNFAPVCTQTITASSRPTRVRYLTPALVAVGTSAGEVIVLKLSPNARKAEHYVTGGQVQARDAAAAALAAAAAPRLSPQQQAAADRALEEQRAMNVLKLFYQDQAARLGSTSN